MKFLQNFETSKAGEWIANGMIILFVVIMIGMFIVLKLDDSKYILQREKDISEMLRDYKAAKQHQAVNETGE